jgi:hypothetical protein
LTIAWLLLSLTPSPVLYVCADAVVVNAIAAMNNEANITFFMVIYFVVT